MRSLCARLAVGAFLSVSLWVGSTLAEEPPAGSQSVLYGSVMTGPPAAAEAQNVPDPDLSRIVPGRYRLKEPPNSPVAVTISLENGRVLASFGEGSREAVVFDRRAPHPSTILMFWRDRDGRSVLRFIVFNDIVGELVRVD